MKTFRTKRNWSLYNQKLQKISRIDFYISSEAIASWDYNGPRLPGGKKLYSDHVVEMCLLMKEYYKLAYRQAQGFISSVLDLMSINVRVPNYTTLSRRASRLTPIIRQKALINHSEGMVVAVDSTGLTLNTSTEWNRKRHGGKAPGYKKWRKLHIAIDTSTGEILSGKYTKSTENDGCQLGDLLEPIKEKISSVCGDMAYDTTNARRIIYEKEARQLVPPIRAARLSENNRNIRKHKLILKERDDAIEYIRHNTINRDTSAARASWKKKVGYHARSLVETTMFQIKAHCTDRLTNRLEGSRATQALIKCKIINKIVAA